MDRVHVAKGDESLGGSPPEREILGSERPPRLEPHSRKFRNQGRGRGEYRSREERETVGDGEWDVLPLLSRLRLGLEAMKFVGW